MIHIEDYYAAVLGEFEQLVLLALLRLGNGAYGATIRREIQDRTHREVPIGSVYVTLARLERKKMVVSYMGLPSKERGGRRRKHYLMHDAGQHALGRSYRALKAMARSALGAASGAIATPVMRATVDSGPEDRMRELPRTA